MTVKLLKDWTGTEWDIWKGCQEKASSCTWTNHKTSGMMFAGHKAKLEMFSHNSKHHIWWKPNTRHKCKYHLSNTVMEAVMIWPCHWTPLYCITNYSRVKCQAVCLRAWFDWNRLMQNNPESKLRPQLNWDGVMRPEGSCASKKSLQTLKKLNNAA